MTIRIGEVVQFRPADIWLPDPAKVVLELNREIKGEVIGFSDRGKQRKVFAVIKIDRVSQSVFVLKDRLKVVPSVTSKNTEAP
jgi:hypothetical protein